MTLLEVLVAFVIAALSLGAIVDGTAGGLRAAGAAAKTEEALARARSHLAAAAIRPAPVEQSGDDGGGYRWRLTVAPIPGLAREAGPALLALRVSVSWTEGSATRQVTLQTERLAPGAGP